MVPSPLTAPLSQMPFLPLPTSRPQLMTHVPPPLRVGDGVSESMPRLVPDDASDGIANHKRAAVGTLPMAQLAEPRWL